MKTVFKIQQGQLGLLRKKGDLTSILTAGEHKINDWRKQLTCEFVDLSIPLIDTKFAQYLRQYHPEWIETYCDVIEVADDQFGLLFEENVWVDILPPSTRRLYWKNGEKRDLKIYSTDEMDIAQKYLAILGQSKIRGRSVRNAQMALMIQIPAWHVGIVNIDGEAKSLLNPGVKGYWRFNHDINVEIVDTRLQVMEVSGQEILTRDKVGLRINLAANWRYSDVLQAYGQLSKPIDYLYRELQFALREAVGTRTLDELLENKQIIDEIVSAHIVETVTQYGLEIASVGVKDIVLPGDMKAILSQVVEAEKSAQANVIRRREETAATRSLLNTAKVMENNPVALRLKELETLESVAQRIDKISVFGGLDQVLNGLVQIKGAI